MAAAFSPKSKSAVATPPASPLIQQRQADVAAVDCVTYSLLKAHRPSAVAGLRVLGRTYRAPAPPYVTRASSTAGFTERMRAALANAFSCPSLKTAREDLFIRGVEPAVELNYRKIIEMELKAAHMGYPRLQ